MVRKYALLLSIVIALAGINSTVYGATPQYNDPESVFATPSGESLSVDEPIRAALNGEALYLDQVYTYNKLMPSRAHINRSVIANLIHDAHVKAKAIARQGDNARAANILRQSLDLSHYMSCLIAKKESWYGPVPRCWIESWKNSAVALAPSDYLAPLNDYAFFLQKCGQDVEAIKIFNAVIVEDKSREVAYLNLADSLKQVGKAQEAGEYYNIYKSLMAREKKTALVPERVDANRKEAIASGVQIGDDVVHYMDFVQTSIKKAWHPPREENSSRVVAMFHVDSDGHVHDIRYTTKSGEEGLDQSCADALAKVTLPPPPKSVKPDDDIEFTFDYNAYQKTQSRAYPIDRWMTDYHEHASTANLLPLLETLVLLHRFDDALGELDEAYKKHPGDTELADARIRIKSARESTNANATAAGDMVKKCLSSAASDTATGKRPPTDSDPIPANHLQAYPEHRKCHALGLLAMNNGAWDLAIEEFSQAVLSYPECKDARLDLARSYSFRATVFKDQTEKAMHELHCAFCVNPPDDWVQKKIVTGMKKLGLDPSSPAGRISYAESLKSSGDLVGAVAEYTIAQKMHEDIATRAKLANLAEKLKANPN